MAQEARWRLSGSVNAVPSSRVHQYIDWLNFGKVYRKIHRKMDEPVWYLGRSHRVLFHNYTSCYIIADECYPRDEDAKMSACLHLHYDELCTRDPECKKMLERFEILSRKQRKKDLTERRKTEQALKKDPILARFIEDVKKLAEAEKWMNFLIDQ